MANWSYLAIVLPIVILILPVLVIVFRSNGLEDENLRFSVRAEITRSDLIKPKLTCSLQNGKSDVTTENCPNYMEAFLQLIKSRDQNIFLVDDRLLSSYQLNQIVFKKHGLDYKTRMKCNVKDLGPSFTNHDVHVQSVFSSKDFNWDNKISFSSKNLSIRISSSAAQSQNIEFHCMDNFSAEKDRCSIIKSQLINDALWISKVFVLKSINYTVTIGVTPEWPFLTADLSVAGTSNDDKSREDIFRNIVDFAKSQEEWCQCMKTLTEAELSMTGNSDKRGACFEIHLTRKEFRKQFDDNVCNLEERIKAASN